MKRILALVFALLLLLAILTGCDNSNMQGSTSKPTISTTDTEILDPTPDDPETNQDPNQSQTHTHTYESTVTAPTCESDGYTTYVCSTCGDTYVADEVAALGHTEQTVSGKKATCTETGLTDGVKCSTCNKVITNQETIPATNHSYKSTVTAPTCEAEGYTTYTCSSCDHSYIGNKVAATGHKAQTIYGKSATCTATGLTNGTKCSVCDKTLSAQTVIPAKGHSYKSTTTVSSCTNQG